MTMPWAVLAIGLLLPLTVAVVATGRGSPGRRLVAVSFASSTAVMLFIALDFIIDQQSSIDLALTLAMLTMPGTLLFALVEERWV